MKVISLDDARFWKSLKRQAWGNFDFDFAYEDVTVFYKGDAPAADDTITMGPKIRAQVAELFSRFGLATDPVTLGELAGNHDYCQGLSCWLPTPSQMDDPDAPGDACERCELAHPGWGLRLAALMAGDVEALRRLHEEADTFASNGRNWQSDDWEQLEG